MIFDYSKLTGLIVQRFSLMESFSYALGMKCNTLIHHLKTGRPFSSSTISKAVDLLGIADDDVSMYFFTRQR